MALIGFGGNLYNTTMVCKDGCFGLLLIPLIKCVVKVESYLVLGESFVDFCKCICLVFFVKPVYISMGDLYYLSASPFSLSARLLCVRASCGPNVSVHLILRPDTSFLIYFELLYRLYC